MRLGLGNCLKFYRLTMQNELLVFCSQFIVTIQLSGFFVKTLLGT